jgi:hypothetical protein
MTASLRPTRFLSELSPQVRNLPTRPTIRACTISRSAIAGSAFATPDGQLDLVGLFGERTTYGPSNLEDRSPRVETLFVPRRRQRAISEMIDFARLFLAFANIPILAGGLPDAISSIESRLGFKGHFAGARTWVVFGRDFGL